MATILNQANLTYTYGTTSASVLSNPAVTERIAAIAIEKRALEHAYRANASLTYLISVENSGAAAVQNLAVHDDLGVFTPAGASAAIRPLTYTGPAVLYLDGELTETLSPVADETGVTFTIPNLPANAAALIVYSAQVNGFAPLETGSTITNTASIALADGALTASATVPVESYANVTIEKEMSPNPVEAGGTLTVTFTIENFGNVPATDVVLTDNENPDDDNSEDPDLADAFDGAAFKAKANSNVYVTGDGTLTINGNAKNGIKAGDDSSLIFDGVTVNINAVNDGINGNYDVTLLSGNFTIAAGDDAIHADHILTIGNPDSGEGPTVRVTQSNEGLEGTVVNIYGGDLSIVSADDAINAANGDGLYEGVLDYSFNMMGGKLSINSQGDGIDSNGNINLIGGSAEIHSATQGGEAGMDYDGQLYISEDFSLNNQSGTAGPDGMGGMPGQMGGVPGDMGSQSLNGQQPPEMGGGFSGQQSGGFGGGPSMGGGFGGPGMRG